MGAELGLLSLTQLRKLAHSQQNPQHQHQPKPSAGSWMWNPKQQAQEDDDSWEVRAFAEDTGNIMGTTWPPRSYTCTFCRREFRSAQALGGHMNVHRRDRARLHQNPPPPPNTSSILNPMNTPISPTSTSTSTFIIPTQEFSTNGGLCLLYQLPHPNSIFTPTNMNNACAMDSSPSTLLSISPYPSNTLVGQSLHNFPGTQPGNNINNSSYFNTTTKPEPSSTSSIENVKSDVNGGNNNDDCKDSTANDEELDLELRLGHRSLTSSSS